MIKCLVIQWVLGLACVVVGVASDSQPNIVLIISDDHNWTHYGFMGNGHVRTPNLDRMAGESLLYTRGYTSPVCSPSLASLLTGLRPREHGITGNDLAVDPAKRGERAPLTARLLANPVILPKVLTEVGYLTFQTGKLWNATYEEMGFTHGMTTKVGRHGGEGLKIGREGMEPIRSFIGQAQEAKKPFFVWYAPFLPHDPHNPPERLLKKYRGKGPTPHGEVYHAMVEWMDETCGELDEILRKAGVFENTVVVYLSDNGWDPEQGIQGGRAKLTPYENGIRTPVMIRWPGKIVPKRDDESLVSIVDIVPTILDLAGADVPELLPGLDLRDREAIAARDTLFVETYTHDIANLDRPVESLTSRVVIHGWEKMIVPGPQVESSPRRAGFAKIEEGVQLFDLKHDPHEKVNLALEKPADVARLRMLMDDWWSVE